MDENIKKILKEQFRTLPDSVKKVIASGDIERMLNTLTEDHPLQDHQLIAIENEVVLILLGFEDLPSFTTNIKHGAQISRERAERITKLIHREIFIPNQAVLSIKTVQKESHNSPTSLETINADHKNDIIKKQEINHISQDAPQQSSPSENDMFHKKLTQQVHIPNKEERINLAEKEGGNGQKKSPQGYAEDPYREPID